MTLDSLKGSMKILKGQIKQKWAKLTEDDINYIDGNVDELVGRIQKSYGEKKEDIRTRIEEMKAKYLDNANDEDTDTSESSQKRDNRGTKSASGREL